MGLAASRHHSPPMHRSFWRLGVLFLTAAIARAEEIDFRRDVQPVLGAKCVRCHGPEKRENGLRLDAGSLVLKGGDSGPAVTAGKAAESLLILAVTGKTDLVSKMPPKG